MIDKSHRFRGHNSLRYAYRKGEIVRGTHVSLRYIDNSRTSAYRVAVVVSRKVHKSAVVRNRIRRRMYEIVREEAGRFGKPVDMIFSVYSEQVASMPADQLKKAVAEQLDSAGFAVPGAPSTASHDIVVPKEK